MADLVGRDVVTGRAWGAGFPVDGHQVVARQAGKARQQATVLARLQAQMGLPADGVLDARTAAALDAAGGGVVHNMAGQVTVWWPPPTAHELAGDDSW